MDLIEKLTAIDEKYKHIMVDDDSCAICEAIERIKELGHYMESDETQPDRVKEGLIKHAELLLC